jgi:hypothetical protein
MQLAHSKVTVQVYSNERSFEMKVIASEAIQT